MLAALAPRSPFTKLWRALCLPMRAAESPATTPIQLCCFICGDVETFHVPAAAIGVEITFAAEAQMLAAGWRFVRHWNNCRHELAYACPSCADLARRAAPAGHVEQCAVLNP